MIKLYQSPPAWGIPNISPACMKLETWLRMVGLPYQPAALDMAKSPKGKIPFIEYKGEILGDSALIVRRLSQDEGIDADAGLSTEQRAISQAFPRMINEHIYWAVIHIRYNTHENWMKYRMVFADIIAPGHPEEVWGPPVDQLRERALAQLHGHGLGRHTPEEISALICEDLQAISDFLGSKPFLMGEDPTTVDATAYAHLANLRSPPFESPIKVSLCEKQNLVAYCERMQARFFPELSGVCP